MQINNSHPNLRINLAGIRLAHPFMNASGVVSSSPGLIRRLIVEGGCSAVVTKSITPKPRLGNNPPILVKLPCGGYINAVGLENPGKEIIRSIVSVGLELGVPVIVSVAGSSADEYLEVSIEAEEAKASAVELNLSCPHTEGYGLVFGQDPEATKYITGMVSSVLKIPVIAKLGPSDNIVKIAGKALEAGAKALTISNTIKAMIIDVYTGRPVLTNIYGGLSGPPLHPVAVRLIYEVYSELEPLIIGAGGVVNGESALEMIFAGASAIQVGSAIIDRGVVVLREILHEFEELLVKLEISDLGQCVGLAHRL